MIRGVAYIAEVERVDDSRQDTDSSDFKKGEGRTLKSGGMWVYDNEIESIMGSFENGDIISVHDFDGYFLGYGFINTNSKITIRILSRKKESMITEEFIELRVRNAWEYRKQTVDTGCCRVILGKRISCRVL